MEITIKHTIELSGTAVWTIIGVAFLFALVPFLINKPPVMRLLHGD